MWVGQRTRVALHPSEASEPAAGWSAVSAYTRVVRVAGSWRRIAVAAHQGLPPPPWGRHVQVPSPPASVAPSVESRPRYAATAPRDEATVREAASVLGALLIWVGAACAPPAPGDSVSAPSIPELLVTLAEARPEPDHIRGLLGGSWASSESDYFNDHGSRDAPGFEEVQLRAPGPKAQSGAILGLELDPAGCVRDEEVHATLGVGAPRPARPGAPSGIRYEVVTRGEVAVHLGFDPDTRCLRRASIRHPRPE